LGTLDAFDQHCDDRVEKKDDKKQKQECGKDIDQFRIDKGLQSPPEVGLWYV
jgi:hypothetical protein